MASVATLVQPTGEMWNQIRVELKENVNTRDQDREHMKEWLKKQPHLPNVLTDQQFMAFLRGASFSLEKCKKKIDMYFTMRAACPEFFTNRDVSRPELADLLYRAQGPPLPGLTPNGRRVTVCRDGITPAPEFVSARTNSCTGVSVHIRPEEDLLTRSKHWPFADVVRLDKDLDTDQLNDAFKFAMMVGDIRILEETEGIAGDVYILDASIVAPSHLGKISPSALKKFLTCIQEAYPLKLKEVHVVNASPLIDTVINIVKPFLKEKIRKRIITHTQIESLYNYVPQEMLPEEYGGNGGSLDDIMKAWIKKLEDYKEWFKEQESYKANESLRPGKPTNYDELFGMDGSFRQLSID